MFGARKRHDDCTYNGVSIYDSSTGNSNHLAFDIDTLCTPAIFLEPFL